MVDYTDDQLRQIAKQYSVEELRQIAAGVTTPLPKQELREIAARGEKVGGLESVGRGALQMGALGYAPEVIAGVKTLGGMRGDYAAERERQKITQEAAWQQHPYAYGAGAVAGLAPAAIGSVVAPEVAAPVAATRLGMAGRAIAASPNVAGLISGTARGIAGATEGKIIPGAIRAGARALESPVVQAGIYGSSLGDTPEEKLTQGAFGAVTGKIGEKVLPLVAKPITSALSGVGQGKIGQLISGSTKDIDVAAALADRLGVSLPAAAKGGIEVGVTTKFDPSQSIPKAAANTLGQINNKVSSFIGDVTPETAGDAITGAARDWLIKGSNDQISALYDPIKSLSGSSSQHVLGEVQKVLSKLRSQKDRVKLLNITPTLDKVEKDLFAASPTGELTFNEMRSLRQALSDKIQFNQVDRDLDQETLKAIRKAVAEDMRAAAGTIAGKSGVTALMDAEKKAADIYAMRDRVNKLIGFDKPGSSVFNNLQRFADVKTGNVKMLNDIKSFVGDDAWNQLAQGYARNLLPGGDFTFKTFSQKYRNISDPAKDLLFGKKGSGGIRDTFDDINRLGALVGSKVDELASKAPVDSAWQAAPVMAGMAEMFAYGLPVKTALGVGAAGMAGKSLARNIARALPEPTERAKFFSVLERNKDIGGLADQAINKIRSGTPLSGKGSEVIDELARKIGLMTGAYLGAKYNEEEIKAMLLLGSMGARKALEGVQGMSFTPSATGGRIQRASGGRTGVNHAAMAAKLVQMAESRKKDLGRRTEPLLQKHDDEIATALAAANKAI